MTAPEPDNREEMREFARMLFADADQSEEDDQ